MAKLKTSYTRRVILVSFRRTKVRRNDIKIAATKQMKIFHDAITRYPSLITSMGLLFFSIRRGK